MRVAAIDQGTTSTRCLVIEDGGQWAVAATRRHAQFHPQPGWVEHDAEELLHNVKAVLAAAGPVDAIALANQGESCLAWDAVTGQSLSPVIVWQDVRTTEGLGHADPADEVRSLQICGLPFEPYFSASKLGWLLEHNPAVVQAHAEGRLRMGTTDAFFLDRLCGVFRTDLATASRTGLLDLATGSWSAGLGNIYGVPIACLPEIFAVDGGFGAIEGTPVRASIVDQQAALFGHGCRAPGDCKITFGTGAFLLALTGSQRPPPCDLLPTIAWKRAGAGQTYAIEGGVYDAGSAIEWARKIGLFTAMEELDVFEGPSALSRGIVFVPALVGLAAPYRDRRAASLFIGMDHATDRRDMIRAILEGIAMLTVGLIEAASAVVPLGPSISIDGGLSQSRYFAQFLADASNRRIVVPHMHELTALGLAELCGIDVAPARAASQTFDDAGTVAPADHARFADAVKRARNWRTTV